MISFARTPHFASFVSILLLVAGATIVGCKSEEPAPFHTGGGNDNPRDASPDEPDDRDSGSSGSGGGSSGGGGGGSGGSGDAGPGQDAGGPDPIVLPDSPTNPWLAYIKLDASSFGQLFFVKADGTGSHEYGGGTFSESDAAWSPDGGKLAFTAVDLEAGTQLRVLDFDAGSDTVLDTGLASMSRPRWSADASTIVVAGSVDTDSPDGLFRVDAESGASEAITSSANGDGGHDFAPNGKLYFVRNLGSSTFEVFSIAATASTSTTPTKITTGAGVLGGVAVHPAGSKLLFARAAGSSTALIEYTITGGAERTLGEAGDEQASYYAGGDFLVVNRDSFDADSEIAVTDGDGVLVERCTDDDASDTAPVASPIESDGVDVTQF